MSNKNHIIITESYLLNAGFEKMSNNHYRKTYFNDGRRLFIYITHLSPYVEISDSDSHEETALIPNPVKYVHQLQNLYYCLTGEHI